ncbi:uncharacterized protein LOC123316608 isoform X2 [Coccinella septempunctata]|uniref:uncharacterized protein LOC123316608 isoform X2 n=1 Tax=Coccinella septempunctata TaxID=41139 RepID=UPI001D06D95F|nr:uncharacterized protein LOC123316608 isoform X2 [Coccinella septempunctata]
MFLRRKNPERGEKSESKLEPLILQNSRIKFSQEQLQNLNHILCKKVQRKRNHTDKHFLKAKSVAERLTQRLLCAVGMLDPRFASKFLVENNPKAINNISNKSLSYLVRLDELSTPPLYELDSVSRLEIIENDQDCPTSYCRIRVPMSEMKTWNEFINPNGFLRRDKVQTRLVKLLAEAAENDRQITPQTIDESVVCGIPGKIVDAATLHHILKIPSFEQIYYGQDGTEVGFPNPSDFRIAIVDDPQGILLRLEFLSAIFDNICLDIRLLIAIGVDAWPSSSDFPRRIHLVHPDCLLYHMAAETGMYLVGFGVQSSAWQIRVPAAEYTILSHYNETSTISTILDILKISEDEIDIPRSLKQYQLSYKILNEYIFLTSLFEELEKNSTKPLNDAVDWSSMYTSKIVLTILDQIMFNLAQQKLPNYFFKQSNLLVNPGHLSEDDYMIEANNIRMFILKLYDESLQNFSSDAEFTTLVKTQENEINLLIKWRDLIDGLLPKVYTKKNGFCLMKSKRRKHFEHLQFTRYQLEYISLVMRSILNVRRRILKFQVTQIHNFNGDEDEQRTEDIAYLTCILMEQAKEKFLHKDAKLDKKRSKLESEYSWYSSRFIEMLRDDTTIKSLDLEDDIVMVHTVIDLLHKAVDFNEKYLARVLQPYLTNLFEVSFEISWHLEDIKSRFDGEELKSLGCFCKLVNAGEITPAQGIVDAKSKNWSWAIEMMRLAENMEIRIVLTPDRGKVNQYVIYPNENSREGMKKTTKDSLERKNTFLDLSELDEENISEHELLKMKSPLTSIVATTHRRGDYRGCGDTFMSLICLRKIGIFNEITSTLPEEEKNNLIEIMNNLQDFQCRNTRDKTWTDTLPKVQKNVFLTSKDVVQKYIPKEESAGVR